MRRNGGRVIVQEPSTATQPSMPSAAIRAGADFVGAPESLAAAITAALDGLALTAAIEEWVRPFGECAV